ncbi:MAG: amidohydrolase [Clostridiales bacterium]|nr:amidohydrolase [Clostridiales bacterium]
MNIDQDIKQLQENIISHRRWLHRYPQVGYLEEKARDYILDFFNTINFDEVKVMAKTGIKAVRYGKNPDKTLAFRADMDALEVIEDTGLEFASQYHGYMHACGHDGHMAILLGFAQWLSENKAELPCNAVLLFQPAEEGIGGALPMIQEGALDNPKVDAIFGYHIMPEIPQGRVGIKDGPFMASTSRITIDLYGIGAHGAMPHKGVDTVLAAAHFITQAQSVLTRRVDPLQPGVITFGKLTAGDVANVIASHAQIKGTIRAFDEGVSVEIEKHLINLLKGMETSHGIRWEFRKDEYYPAVVNHPELTNRLRSVIPEQMQFEAGLMMIAEDFAFYQQRVPGVFLYLGSRNEEKGYTYPLHSNKFQFDEAILLTGVQLYKDILFHI